MGTEALIIGRSEQYHMLFGWNDLWCLLQDQVLVQNQKVLRSRSWEQTRLGIYRCHQKHLHWDCNTEIRNIVFKVDRDQDGQPIHRTLNRPKFGCKVQPKITTSASLSWSFEWNFLCTDMRNFFTHFVHFGLKSSQKFVLFWQWLRMIVLYDRSFVTQKISEKRETSEKSSRISEKRLFVA